MIKDMIGKLLEKDNLTREEAKAAMDLIMDGKVTPVQIASFLTALRMKGETIDEITGFAFSMREKAEQIRPDVPYLIDTCGTGGDKADTFNISTGAAIVAAAAGIKVAKHGNRSVSSKCGSADVLEALGIDINLPADMVSRSINETGFGFLFAQKFHGAMKHAAAPRRELGIRTVFNILGPLANPAGAKGQLLGVYRPEFTEKLAQVLLNLHTEHAMVIHSDDGLDELSVCAPTKITELVNGRMKTYTVRPEDFGMPIRQRKEILGGGPETNAKIILMVLKGEKGAKRDITALNAGAAIYIGKGAISLAEGVKMAFETLDNGSSYRKFKEIVEFTNMVSKAAEK